jgi:hypothetical protein
MPLSRRKLVERAHLLSEQAGIKVKQSRRIDIDPRKIRVGRVEQVVVFAWYDRGRDLKHGCFPAVDPTVAQRL